MMLYKYYPINTNTINSLSERGLWCHYPSQMNDPFECLTIIERKFNAEELDSLRSYFSKAKTEDLRKLAHLNNEKLSLLFNRYRAECVKKFTFCALTENAFDILMWSHYADSHKGICVGFEFNELGNNNIFQQVIYLDKLKEYDLMTMARFMDYDDSLLSYILNDISIKSSDWQREKEWRIWMNSPGYYSYRDMEIKEVHFGISCTDATKRMVLKLVSDISNVTFYEMTTTVNPFKLVRDVIS